VRRGPLGLFGCGLDRRAVIGAQLSDASSVCLQPFRYLQQMCCVGSWIGCLRLHRIHFPVGRLQQMVDDGILVALSGSEHRGVGFGEDCFWLLPVQRGNHRNSRDSRYQTLPRTGHLSKAHSMPGIANGDNPPLSLPYH
jgi:hypothetical protein